MINRSLSGYQFPPSLREVAFSQENDGGSLLVNMLTPSVSLRSTAPSKRERKFHFALIISTTNYNLLFNNTKSKSEYKKSEVLNSDFKELSIFL